MEEQIKVSYSSYEIHADNDVIRVGTPIEAQAKFKNAKSREKSICYLYRLDYDEKDKLIETYLIG